MSLRYDYLHFNASITDEGFLRDEAIVTRTGVFEYRGPEGVRRELRHPDDVFDGESLASMKFIPITHNHPDGLVNAENCKAIAVGSVGENIRTDGKYVIAPLVVNDSKTVQVRSMNTRTPLQARLHLGDTIVPLTRHHDLHTLQVKLMLSLEDLPAWTRGDIVSPDKQVVFEARKVGH